MLRQLPMAIKVTTLLSQGLIKENGSQQEASNYPFSVSWVIRNAEECFIHQNVANLKRPSSRECWPPPGGEEWYCGSWHPNGAKCKKERERERKKETLKE